MNLAQTKQTALHSLRWWFMRGFWALLAAVHVWPLAIVSVEFFTAPSVSAGLGLVVVFGVTGVFALKAVDALMLRFHRPGLEFTALVIITALIHGDTRAGRRSPALAAETATSIVLVSGGAVIGSRRLRNHFAKLLRHLAARVTLACVRHPIGLVAVAVGFGTDQVWRHCTPARAPPSLVL